HRPLGRLSSSRTSISMGRAVPRGNRLLPEHVTRWRDRHSDLTSFSGRALLPCFSNGPAGTGVLSDRIAQCVRMPHGGELSGSATPADVSAHIVGWMKPCEAIS